MLHKWFDHWVFRAYRVDVRALALLRVLFALYVLWQGFFRLDLMGEIVSNSDWEFWGVGLGESGVPGWVLAGTTLLGLLAAGLLLLGCWTAWASRLLGLSLLFHYAMWDSIATGLPNGFWIAFPLIMSWSGWGQAWSIDAKGEDVAPHVAAWPLALWAMCIGFFVAATGWQHLRMGWLGAQHTVLMEHAAGNIHFGKGAFAGQGCLMGYNLEPNGWKALDLAFVAFELIFLPACLMVRAFRIAILGLLAFNFGMCFLLGQDTLLFSLALLPFLAWSGINFERWPRQIALRKVPAWGGLILAMGLAFLAWIWMLLRPAWAQEWPFISVLSGGLCLFAALLWLWNAYKIRRGA